ncbi:hypothetical protein CASFOL_015719 [Castilleja foliolosa]|uniref:PB1 domain-containing protein n=1 Tax=Castilleja foliolosa TaxID=1961234 RepID=A0ABD3DIJ8_9LAMI
MDPQPGSASPSPRSRPAAAEWDDNINNLPPVPGAAAKLRLMCSYGGHIIPRPHDKSLSYIGGDTRIVVADRRSSLSELHSRLSQTLLNGRHFTLKYQLPAEDLDSLISLSTDEDLDNMIEEYDRTATISTTSASPLKPPSRLRLFLFPSMPETAASMGSLLDDAKSETWFVDALNGAGLLPRGLSESAAIDTLLDLEAQNEESSLGNNVKQVVGKSNNDQNQVEMVSIDSPPMVETNSSFESSSSSPSMANLPPIKVRGGEVYMMMAGLDEQFSHVSIVDEKSDAATGRLRKPPLPLQTVQRKLVDIHNLPSPDSKHAVPYSLPSPDSVTSDNSNASPGSLSKQNTIYQDAARQHMNQINPTPSSDPKTITSNITQEPTPQVLIQHQSDPAPVPHPNQHHQQQQQQQQFIHPHHNYIHHSFYPMYLHPQTQQPVQHQTDQPYPIYLLPPNNAVPNYPTKPEMAGNIHPGVGSGATPVYVQVPTNQYQPQQQQYDNAANYGYEYNPHPRHHMADQLYYGRQMAGSAPPPQPSQYQTMTPATVMLAQTSSQMPTDSNGQQ